VCCRQRTLFPSGRVPCVVSDAVGRKRIRDVVRPPRRSLFVRLLRVRREGIEQRRAGRLTGRPRALRRSAGRAAPTPASARASGWRRSDGAIAIDPLVPRVEAAFTGPVLWEPFVRDARASDIPRLSDWLEGVGRVVADQFRRRGLRSLRPADMPVSTSAMDGLIGPIRDALHPRRYGLKNRAGTNRLLMLMQVHTTARTTRSPTPGTSVRAWRRTTAGHASPGAPSSARPASPRCADLTQNAPSYAIGGSA
jgi:hypothetical protein